MLMFNENIRVKNTAHNINVLTVPEYQEIYFDIYELELNGSKYIAEKIDEYKGSPVISIPLVIEGKEYTAPFVLQQGEFSALFNKDNSSFVQDVSHKESIENIVDDLLTIEDIAPDDFNEIVFKNKESLLEDIQKAKRFNRESSKSLDQKNLEEASKQLTDRLEKIVNNRIKSVTESNNNLNQNTRDDCINLIIERENSILSAIEQLKTDVPNIVIKEANGSVREIDLKAVKKELEKSIAGKFTTEISSLKRLIELSSGGGGGGGGSVAVQYANGGTMNGSLDINGRILSGGRDINEIFRNTISQILSTEAYLPKSGGTVSGQLSVAGAAALTVNTNWFNIPYSFEAANEIIVDGSTEILSISGLYSEVQESLTKVQPLYIPTTTYFNTTSTYNIQGTLEELIANNAYDVSSLQTVVSAEQVQIDDLNSRVAALYSYLIQNFDKNIVVTSSSIANFIANEWSSNLGLVPGSTVILSAANVAYILGNSDGSGVNDYFELNLKPNYLFYKTGLQNYALLDAFPLSAMKSSKYVLQVEDSYTGDIYYGEINLVANNTIVVASEYSSNHTTEYPFVEFGASIKNQRVCLSAIAMNTHMMSNFIFKGNRTNFF
jgi:hypothetical protein